MHLLKFIFIITLVTFSSIGMMYFGLWFPELKYISHKYKVHSSIMIIIGTLLCDGLLALSYWT